ncbi:BQ2448_1811 [Microbotryum intermedium]|uniref:BQ2448_1811 protein n=1 Tax=Microbotryum intermedium TaxID=269621 RepID=A0A238FB78_9BASI|nr:BQ2448_1811 [Microbotryum intermedium]
MLIRGIISSVLLASMCSALPIYHLYTRALNILGLVNLEPNILTPGNSLINTNVLANVLGPRNCTGKGVLGVQTNLQLFNLLKVCSCVEVLNPLSNQAACPPCPANASPICAQASGQCGCECNRCPLPNHLIATLLGTTKCVCSRGYVDDLAGGCISACLVIG